MRRRDERSYLRDISESCDAIIGFIEGMSLDDYVADRKTRSAVEREFTIVGEAMTRLLDHAPVIETQLSDSRKIVAFRNVIVHGYAEVDDRVVWDTIRRHVPKLREQVEALLRSAGTGS